MGCARAESSRLSINSWRGQRRGEWRRGFFREEVHRKLQLSYIEGFREHHVHLQFLVGLDVLLGQMCREDDNLARELAHPQPTHQFESVHTRHAMVGNNDVERFRGGADLHERHPAIARASGSTFSRRAKATSPPRPSGIVASSRTAAKGFPSASARL